MVISWIPLGWDATRFTRTPSRRVELRQLQAPRSCGNRKMLHSDECTSGILRPRQPKESRRHQEALGQESGPQLLVHGLRSPAEASTNPPGEMPQGEVTGENNRAPFDKPREVRHASWCPDWPAPERVAPRRRFRIRV